MFVERRARAGFSVLDALPARRVDFPLPEATLARVAGTGWLIGDELAWQLWREPRYAAAVRQACGLLNLLFSLFDHVIDERPDAAPGLLAVLTRDSVAALGPLATFDGSDAVAALTADVAAAAFSACRQLAGAGTDTLREQLARMLATAYDAQLVTTAVADAAALDAALAQKRQLPGRVLALTALLPPASPGHDVQVAPALAVLGHAGELFDLADELCDVERDLAHGHPNALALRAAAPDMATLMQSGALEQALRELESGLDTIARDGDGVLRDPRRFSHALHLWLSGGFNPFPEARPGWLATAPLPALERACAFLDSVQHADGGYRSDIASDLAMHDAAPAESVYLHAFVMHALSAVVGHVRGVDGMLARAASYLRVEQEPDAWWRFFGCSGGEPGPDADDTAVSLAALLRAGTDSGAAEEAHAWLDSIATLRTESGLYRTWADPALNTLGLELPDSAVNANVLLLQGLLGRAEPRLAAFFERVVRVDAYGLLNLYAISPFALPYLISRCYSDAGVPISELALDRLCRHVEVWQYAEGGWGNDMDSALGAITLLNTGRRPDAVARAAAHLVRRQAADGGWDRGPFFRDLEGQCYGARSFTTALCAELLARIRAWE